MAPPPPPVDEARSRSQPATGISTEPAPPRWHRLALVPLVVMACLIAVFLLGDASAFVNSGTDEILGHAGASAGLTVAAAGTFLVLMRRRPSAESVMLAGAALTMLFEGAQRFAPGRGVQLQDLFSGLGGVLVAALGLEIVLSRFHREQSTLLLACSAAVACCLLGLVLLLPSPRNVVNARPGTSSCPATEILGAGERLAIGPGPVTDNCVDTGHGGLSFVGPKGATFLADDGVLTSSALTELSERIKETGSVTIRVTVQTEAEVSGAVLMLWERGSGTFLYLNTNGTTLTTLGPNLGQGGRSTTSADALAPQTSHIIEVVVASDSLTTSVDGVLVAQAAMADWLGHFQGEELQLLVGNVGSRQQTFSGTVDWIEIEAG